MLYFVSICKHLLLDHKMFNQINKKWFSSLELLIIIKYEKANTTEFTKSFTKHYILIRQFSGGLSGQQ